MKTKYTPSLIYLIAYITPFSTNSLNCLLYDVRLLHCLCVRLFFTTMVQFIEVYNNSFMHSSFNVPHRISVKSQKVLSSLLILEYFDTRRNSWVQSVQLLWPWNEPPPSLTTGIKVFLLYLVFLG